MKIGAFSWQLGKCHDLETLPGIRNDKAKIEKLKKIGLTSYCVRENKIDDMLVDVMNKCLSDSGVQNTDVDTVVVSMTENNGKEDVGLVPSVLDRCELVNAKPYGLTLGACANLVYALEVCEGLISIGKAKNIMLVFSDIYHDALSRFLRHDSGLGSDGVGACMISEELKKGFRIKSVVSRYDSKAYDAIEKEDIVNFIRKYSDGVKLSVNKALIDAGLDIKECKLMITPNFSTTVLKNISKICKFDTGLIYANMKPGKGHCSSVDQIIALSNTLDDEIDNHAPVLVSCPADFVWGASVMLVDKGIY